MISKFKKTLVLDSGYIPRGVISSDRAFVITYKGNAEIIHNHSEYFQLVNPDTKIPKPSIIRINKYINIPFHRVRLTRENIYRRDNYECVYCGDNDRKKLTLDHVIPKSKGGTDRWDNLVTACKKCNLEKADLTIEEFGRKMPKLFKPHYLSLLRKIEHFPDEWKKFFF